MEANEGDSDIHLVSIRLFVLTLGTNLRLSLVSSISDVIELIDWISSYALAVEARINKSSSSTELLLIRASSGSEDDFISDFSFGTLFPILGSKTSFEFPVP